MIGRNMTDLVPLFPLKTVLYPDGSLSLRIFEPRYLDMIGRCLRQTQNFGVLSILEGEEVGPASTATIGTLAEIVDWYQEPDGLLGITVTGRERFEVGEISVLDDGLYVGRITLLAAEPRLALPADYEYLAGLLRQVLPAVGTAPSGGKEYADATWVGYRLAEILPLPLEDKQECLEMEDSLARLDKLRATLN